MNKFPLFQKGHSGGMNFKPTINTLSPYFLFFFILFIVLAFLVLSLRLFQLTVVKGEYYRRLSEQNRIRELTIEPQRGTIFDRKGFIVAHNLAPDLQQISARIRSQRLYESPEAVAHLIGYRQIADLNNLKNDLCLQKLKNSDRVGKKGIEKIFDCQLRGIYGKKIVEVDASGKYLKTLYVVAAEKGQDLKLALDLVLQKKIYELVADTKAAVVATRPKTGEVLALISTPSFNSQDFEDQSVAKTNDYLTDKNKPLFNRVTEGLYPPGSVFKLAIATGALEEKKIDEKFQIEDTGTIKAGPLSFGNWYFLQYGKTDGLVNIVKGIRRSNDIFFYKTGELLGVDKTKAWAQTLGYGKKTGIGFEEVEGIVPSPFWKEETLGDRWYLGDTYNLSIGQGFLSVTPLQVNQATAVFANGGHLCTPQLLKVGNGRDRSLQNCKKLPISQKTLNLIREGMKEACSPGGTGWPLFEFRIQVACKTGTAESQDKASLPHAWITAFAPFENPEIALTVLVETAGQGSDIAGPIAKEILKTYFERSE